MAHAGVQPVNWAATCQGGFHHGPAGNDQGPGVGAQLNPGTSGDFQQLLNRQ